ESGGDRQRALRHYQTQCGGLAGRTREAEGHGARAGEEGEGDTSRGATEEGRRTGSEGPSKEVNSAEIHTQNTTSRRRALVGPGRREMCRFPGDRSAVLDPRPRCGYFAKVLVPDVGAMIE